MEGRLSMQICPSVLHRLHELVALQPALMGLRLEPMTLETDKERFKFFYWSKKHLQSKLESH